GGGEQQQGGGEPRPEMAERGERSDRGGDRGDRGDRGGDRGDRGGHRGDRGGRDRGPPRERGRRVSNQGSAARAATGVYNSLRICEVGCGVLTAPRSSLTPLKSASSCSAAVPTAFFNARSIRKTAFPYLTNVTYLTHLTSNLVSASSAPTYAPPSLPGDTPPVADPSSSVIPTHSKSPSPSPATLATAPIPNPARAQFAATASAAR